jgi:hypothetical protein
MINYDDFQHVNFVFSQIFILLFWGLFDDVTDLRVRVALKSTSVGGRNSGIQHAKELFESVKKQVHIQWELWWANNRIVMHLKKKEGDLSIASG